MLKRIFGKSSPAGTAQEVSIEDLIVLERYDEAIGRLEARVRDFPNDLHAHLRLGEVLAQVGKGGRALDQFLYVADMYSDDGFYDKALALLTKITRLAPGDDSVRLKTAHIQKLKQLEQSRARVVEGLIEAQKGQSPLSRTSPVEIERIWETLAGTSILKRFSSEHLRRLFAGCEIGQVERGAVIARAGSLEPFLLIVVSGSIEARRELEPGRSYQLRTFFAGDVFGEQSLLEHKPWQADYSALERTRFMRVNKEGLERTMVGNPDPRGMLEAMRAQHCDRDVAEAADRVAGLRQE